MKETSQIYVQLEYNEALNSKKEILSSEISLLNLIKIMQRYNSLRLEELKVKSKIRTATKMLGAKAREVQSSFPFLTLSKEMGKFNLNEKKSGEVRQKFDESIETQLKEIQNKLRAIEGR
jgi:hypothetical protein